MQMLAQLRSFDPTANVSIDELVALLTVGDGMVSTYSKHDLEVPEWLLGTNKRLSLEIENRRKEAAARRLRELEAEELSDRTRSERKSDRESEMRRLRRVTGNNA